MFFLQVSPSSRSVQQSAAGIRAVPHSFSPSSQLQNAVAAAALVNRPGKHAVHQGSKVSRGSSRSADPMTSSGWRKQSRGAAGRFWSKLLDDTMIASFVFMLSGFVHFLVTLCFCHF